MLRDAFPFAGRPADTSQATLSRRYPESVPTQDVERAEGMLDGGASYPEAAAAVGCSVEALAAAIARRRNPLPGDSQFILRGTPLQRARLDAFAHSDESYREVLDRLLDVVEALRRAGLQVPGIA